MAEKLKLIKKGQLLIVRGTLGQGLTARGRVMKSPIDQEIRFIHPNKFYNLRLEHIRGPLTGVQLHFAVARARKSSQQPICVCDAYPWPHIKGIKKCQAK